MRVRSWTLRAAHDDADTELVMGMPAERMGVSAESHPRLSSRSGYLEPALVIAPCHRTRNEPRELSIPSRMRRASTEDFNALIDGNYQNRALGGREVEASKAKTA